MPDYNRDVVRRFGRIVTALIQKKDLSADDLKFSFKVVLKDEVPEMAQGAFFAALKAKPETTAEITEAYEAIYRYDTVKVDVNREFVDNCGTGMDAVKTFNISTASAVTAASLGVPMLRHGARAITGMIGTVDLAEALGIGVEMDVPEVIRSFEKCGIGLFNGMSATVHPQALSRILAKTNFATVLNIAASLAGPVRPSFGVRGVYDPSLLKQAAGIMKQIGYRRAVLVHGYADSEKSAGMDEASVCGLSELALLHEDGSICKDVLDPSGFLKEIYRKEDLAPCGTLEEEVRAFVKIFAKKPSGVTDRARRDSVALNTTLILKTAGVCASYQDGYEATLEAIEDGRAYNKLKEWIASQSHNPQSALKYFESLS